MPIKSGYPWIGLPIYYLDGGTRWPGHVVDVIGDAAYLYFGSQYSCTTNTNNKTYNFIQYGPMSAWDSQFVLETEAERAITRPRNSTIGMRVKYNGPDGVLEGYVVDIVSCTSYLLFDGFNFPLAKSPNGILFHLTQHDSPVMWDLNYFWDGPPSTTARDSLYCSCGGPSKKITILFQDVSVCTTCKKEKK